MNKVSTASEINWSPEKVEDRIYVFNNAPIKTVFLNMENVHGEDETLGIWNAIDFSNIDSGNKINVVINHTNHRPSLRARIQIRDLIAKKYQDKWSTVYFIGIEFKFIYFARFVGSLLGISVQFLESTDDLDRLISGQYNIGDTD